MSDSNLKDVFIKLYGDLTRLQIEVTVRELQVKKLVDMLVVAGVPQQVISNVLKEVDDDVRKEAKTRAASS